MKKVIVQGGSIGVAEPGDPVIGIPYVPDTTPAAIDWAKAKREKESADAADPVVQGLITDVQAVKADIKAAPSGNLTLTKSQLLKLVRGLLFVLKDDKTE